MEYAFKYVLQTIKFQERGISFEKMGVSQLVPMPLEFLLNNSYAKHLRYRPI